MGDCIFLPAGVIHALGPGLLVAEIQQSSDTTYRLYDWDRVGPDGQPRELHLEHGLSTIDYKFGPVKVQTPQPTDRPHVERLVKCDKFVLDRWKLTAPQTIGGSGSCHIVAVLEGSLHLAGDPSGQPLERGEVALIPAQCGGILATPQKPATILDICLP